MNINNKRAFTLVELLVVIAIIGVISTLATISFSNSRLSARDAKRLSDIRLMSNALELYYADHGSYPDEVDFQPGQSLISTDGQIIYLASVPDNPIPWTDGDCPEENYGYETSDGSSYLITTCLGGESATFAPGVITYSPEEGLIGQTPEGGGGGGPVASFNCGDPIEDDDGNEYNTVQIGTQCWMKENLKVGTMVNSQFNSPCVYISSVPGYSCQNNNAVIQKYCYGNNASNCETYGALYEWHQAMNLPTACANTNCSGSIQDPHQGICPTGWHIPTDEEFNTLELYTLATINSQNNQYPCSTGELTWSRCADNNGTEAGGPSGVGKSLKLGSNYSNDNLVGFSMLMSGGGSPSRSPSGGFNNVGFYGFLWLSDETSTINVLTRQLYSENRTIRRANAFNKLWALSVRCVKD
ncbi:MAG: FISUMP domain-containing protein [Patescibacteria group bacterium]|nr:MAG: FISUMP domain-containing protein [Patescibacteria group bacterium]